MHFTPFMAALALSWFSHGVAILSLERGHWSLRETRVNRNLRSSNRCLLGFCNNARSIDLKCSSRTFTSPSIQNKVIQHPISFLQQRTCVGFVNQFRRSALKSSSKNQWRCLGQNFEKNGDDETMGIEESESLPLVILRDIKSDRVIECFVDREIELNGKSYATLFPANTPVIFAEVEMINGKEKLTPILQDESIDKLFPIAFSVLAEMDMSLARSAVVLTIEGYDDEEEDEEEEEEEELSHSQVGCSHVGLRMDQLVDANALQGGSETSWPAEWAGLQDDEKDEDNHEEREEIEVLTTFFFEGKKHVVAALLDPFIMIGEPLPQAVAAAAASPLPAGEQTAMSSMFSGDGTHPVYEGEYILPDKEELNAITPLIEQELVTLIDQEEEDKRKISSFRAKLIQQWNS